MLKSLGTAGRRAEDVQLPETLAGREVEQIKLVW
jgi:hypothetical protein